MLSSLLEECEGACVVEDEVLRQAEKEGVTGVVTGLQVPVNTELRVLYVMYVVQICTGGTFYL